MRPFANHRPLTEAEFDRLEAFLGAVKNRQAMSLEEMDGFFVALVCGPEAVLPGEYLPLVWGGEPSFESIEEAQEGINLVMRHWNTIAGTLYKGEVYIPLLMEGEDGIASGNDWSKGFLCGMDLRHDAWGALVNDDQHGGSLVPILALAHEHDPGSTMRPKPIAPKQREKLLAHLTAGIALIYRYFRQGRTVHAAL
jgi:uncharacterized protein